MRYSQRLVGERCLACDHSMLFVESYSIYFLLENDFLDRLHKLQLWPKTPEAFSCSSTCFVPYQELSCSCLPQLHFVEFTLRKVNHSPHYQRIPSSLPFPRLASNLSVSKQTSEISRVLCFVGAFLLFHFP